MLIKLRSKLARARTLYKRISKNSRKEKSQRSDFYRQLWIQAAREFGAEVTVYSEIVVVRKDGSQAKLFRNYTDLDGPATLRAVGNKPLVSEILQAHGIPTPDCSVFKLKTLGKAQAFLDEFKVCVVKPASGTGAGAGVTTNIKDSRQLAKAAIHASGFDSELLIEKQIEGSNVRLLFLDGELLDAIERRPPTVFGDGKSTIGQLIQVANRRRSDEGLNAAQVFLNFDLDMRRTLEEQGFTRRSVPAKGETVKLKTVINDNAAEDNVSVSNELSTSAIEIARDAARAMGVRLAGVDIVTPDLTANLDAAGGVVLEVNTTPGLYIHQQGELNQVALSILRACLLDSQKFRTQHQTEKNHAN